MSRTYLGEEIVDPKDTEFKNFRKADWALYFIERYGQFDGSHHKQWVMDQVVRIFKGTPIIVTIVRWSDGQEEYRVHLGEPSKKYLKWVREMCAGEDGPATYSYDEGVAP